MRRKTKNKEKEKEKIIPEKMIEETLESDIGAILNLTADEDNPVSDGKEFKKEDDKNE